MEQHAAKPLLRIDLFSCVLISVSCVFLYNKRRKPIVDCRDDGRLEDVNMNSRGLLCPRFLTSAQYWRLQRRESATWIHQTIFVQFKDRRCSASLQTPFFALSIFPRVQEPAAIRPCGLRVFQTHYQDDNKKYRAPFSALRHTVRGAMRHFGYPKSGRRWQGGDFHSAERVFFGLADGFPVKKACVSC